MNNLDPKYVWQYFFTSLLGWVILAWAIVFFVRPVLTVFGGTARDLASSQSVSTQVNPNIEKNFNSEIEQGLNSSTQWVVWVLALVVLLFADWFWAKITYKNLRYEMSDEGFKKEQGVIYKKYITIPYRKVQNVNIIRGLSDRIFGLSVLEIETAGQSGVSFAEARIPGLNKQTAEELRQQIIAKIKS